MNSLMLVDTHCHLNMPEAFPDPAAEVRYAQEEGVARLVVIGVNLETSRRAVELASAHPEVYATVGIHPNYCANFAPGDLVALREMLQHPKVSAVGEIGLDYHWDYATPEQQEAALRAQLELALEIKKPVVFHCRKAYAALLDLIEPLPRNHYLFHCFSGDAADAARAVALGAWFGVDGPITYKNGGDLRDLVKLLPRDRILIETDSPYLTPEPHRGKPNRPGYVRFVNNGLAAALGLSPEDCAATTTANAEAFFNLGLDARD